MSKGLALTIIIGVLVLSLALVSFGTIAASEYGLVLVGDDTFLRISPGVETTTLITIKNLGIKEDTFAIAADGINWASLDMEKITLKPLETADFVLKLNPPEGEVVEEYVRLSATSLGSNLQSTWGIYVSTNDISGNGLVGSAVSGNGGSSSTTGLTSFASGSGAAAILAFAIIAAMLLIFKNRAKRAGNGKYNIEGTGKK